MPVFSVSPSLAAPLFEGWEETPVWSCLDGIMGQAQADSPVRPRSGRILIGDFCFLAGEPTPELAAWPQGRSSGFLLMLPRHEGWNPVIEKAYPGHFCLTSRFAFHKDPAAFDREALERLAAAPAGYSIRMMDEPLYRQALSSPWSRDLVSNYSGWEDYARLGLGAAALKDGELVCGASAYSRYRKGIEIEIDTREDHRRRGLARACAARLILACLDRGLYPSWDAANPMSASLARQLGYRSAGEYPAYEITL